jgi:hypothetical protein
VIRTRLRCEAIRICGSGKLRADPEITPASAFFPPMNFTRGKVFGHFKGLSASFFGASPDRFTLRSLSALD